MQNNGGFGSDRPDSNMFSLMIIVQPYNLVLDRCYMDVVVYTKFMKGVTSHTYSYIEDTWNRVKNEYTHYIYFPIEFDSVDDGVRSISEEWRKEVGSNKPLWLMIMCISVIALCFIEVDLPNHQKI